MLSNDSHAFRWYKCHAFGFPRRLCLPFHSIPFRSVSFNCLRVIISAREIRIHCRLCTLYTSHNNHANWFIVCKTYTMRMELKMCAHDYQIKINSSDKQKHDNYNEPAFKYKNNCNCFSLESSRHMCVRAYVRAYVCSSGEYTCMWVCMCEGFFFVCIVKTKE